MPIDWEKLKDPHADIEKALSPLSEAIGAAVENLGANIKKEAQKLESVTQDLEHELVKRQKQARKVEKETQALAKAVEAEEAAGRKINKRYLAQIQKAISKQTLSRIDYSQLSVAGKMKALKQKPTESPNLKSLFATEMNQIAKEQADLASHSPAPRPQPVDLGFDQMEAPFGKGGELIGNFWEAVKKPNIMDSFTAKLEKAAKWKEDLDEYKSKGFIDRLKDFGSLTSGQKGLVLASAAWKTTGAVIGGTTSAIGGAYDLLKKIFTYTYDFINQKVLPTHSALNKALGATSTGMNGLSKQAMTVADQFWDLGLGFDQGRDDVIQLGVAMNTVRIPDAALKSLIKISEYVGVGSEQAGKLANSFLATGTRVEDLGAKLNEVFINGAVVAQKYDIPINILNKDFADNIDLMQRYGSTNYQQFQKSIAVARRYNVSIRDIEKTFGKAMDTFESTAQTSAKLNSIFGTSIDSLKLLNMETADERFMYFREELSKQGIVWDKLTGSQGKFAKNIITSTLGIDEAQGALYFGTQRTRKEQQKLLDKQAANAKASKDWDNAIQSLRTQLVDWNRQLSKVYMAIGNVIGRFFGFKNGADATTKGVALLKNISEAAAKAINEFAERIPAGNDGFGQIAGWIEKVDQIVQNASRSLAQMSDLIDKITSPKDYFLATRWIKSYDEALKKGDVGFLKRQDASVATTDAEFQALYKSRYAMMHNGENYLPYEQKQARKAKVDAQYDSMSSLSSKSSLPSSLARPLDMQQMTLPPIIVNVSLETDRLGRTMIGKTVRASQGQGS